MKTSIPQTMGWLHKVGEHLEAVENYSQAAKVYVHALEHYAYLDMDRLSQLVRRRRLGL
jgi:hypothetical protein